MPKTSTPTKRLAAPDRREQILQAARRVFTKSGYGSSRIKAISEEAGVNEALLYRHFPSKEALFEAAIIEPLQQSVERTLALGLEADERMTADDARRDYVVELLEEMLTGVAEIAPLLGVVLYGDEELAADFYRERFSPALDQLAEGLGRFQASHDVPPYDPRTVIDLCIGAALLLALDDRYQRDPGPAIRERAQALADHVLRMTWPVAG